MNKKIIPGIAGILIIALLLAISVSSIKNKNIQTGNLNITYAGPGGNLSNARIAVLYEKVTDREINSGRSLEETVSVLKGTRPDLIFRGFWIWNAPVPDSPDNIPPELTDLAVERLNIKPEQVPEAVRKSGFSYEELRTSIAAIKKEMPGVIFAGAIPAQAVGRIDMNPMTGKVLSTEDTWKMALDPKKWDITFQYEGRTVTKEYLQEIKASSNQETFKNGYDYREAYGYLPDITNTDFQELFLSWAKKQIDSGADAIWIDMLYSQAQLFYDMTNDTNNPAVKESYDAASRLVDEIHAYGESKGKYIYVGTWSEPVIYYPGAPPKLDFITTTPSPEEIKGEFDGERWNKIDSGIKNKFGNIPHFAFIDWGGRPNAPMDAFSQQLSKEQQKEWLKKADAFFQGKGIIFVYPVHGADFWGDAKVRAFGKFPKYDALAPEFGTFGTIKELAGKKAKGEGHG